MSDQAALLRAIIDEPDEDVHRLVYADWLEEQGDTTRAEFIRAQCRLAPFCVDLGPFETGIKPVHLLPEHRQAWLAPFLALGLHLRDPNAEDPEPLDGFNFLFRRGLVESMVIDGPRAARQFLRKAPDVFALGPLLHLRFTGGYFEYRPLRAPLVKRLVSLPNIGHLRTLDLRGHGLGEEGAQALLASPYLTTRTRVFFERNRLPPPALDALKARFGDAISGGPPYDPADDDIPF